MKKQIFVMVFVMVILSSAMVSSASSFTFKLDEEVNFRFRCLDVDNNYCTSSTQLTISVEYPDGTNALDNQSMTHNPTYYNVTLPTNTLGIYSSIIISPTSNGTISEFSYEVTPTGKQINTNNIALFYPIGFIIIMAFLLWSMLGIMISLVEVDTTIYDIFKSMITYFVFIFFYYFSKMYFADTFVIELGDVFLWIFGFTHLILPPIILIITWIRRQTIE